MMSTELEGADLSGACLRKAVLVGARLCGANLSGADLSIANIGPADLSRTNLRDADLHGARLSLGTSLQGANLAGANLSNANLANADLTGADLSGCRVYGVAAWRLKLNQHTRRRNLIITRHNEPEITVDNIEIAQFVDLLLHNDKIRDAIDTIGKKGVLLPGRFSGERMVVLERLREELRRRDLLPIVFNFAKPQSKNFTETVRLLAGMSHFVIADITRPKSTPLDLQATVPQCMIPFVTIIEDGEKPFSMFKDLWIAHKRWVFPTACLFVREPTYTRVGSGNHRSRANTIQGTAQGQGRGDADQALGQARSWLNRRLVKYDKRMLHMTRTIVITVMLVGMTTMANAGIIAGPVVQVWSVAALGIVVPNPIPTTKLRLKATYSWLARRTGAETTQMDVSTLKPDGSGKLTYMSKKNVAYTFEVDAGTGPRKVTMASANTPCKFLYTPK